jgi:hypothetical protein
MASGELKPAPRSEKPRALFDEERATFLIVDAAGCCRVKESTRCRHRSGARPRVAFDFVKHRSLDIFERDRAAGGHEDDPVTRGSEGGERRHRHNCKWQPEAPDRFAHARKKRSRIRCVADDHVRAGVFAAA